jgi:hypothetical protein
MGKVLRCKKKRIAAGHDDPPADPVSGAVRAKARAF